MLEGYAALGGNEIVNNERARVYAARMGITALRCPPCAGLPAALGDDPYSSPAPDKAPWHDPALSASDRFAGVVGLEVSGASASTAGRSPVDLLGDGAAIGALRRDRREMTWRVALLAADDCGLSYGIGWLASALRGAACDPDCRGDELCVFACCPTCGSGGECGARQQRTLYHAGLLEGPDIKSRYALAGGGCGGPGGTGGQVAEAEFTLVAGLPWFYRRPVLVAGPGDGVTDAPPPVGGDCQPAGDCLTDPDCPPLPGPPLPPTPADPCYPTGDFPARRTVITVPGGTLPAWSEVVPVITVTTGRRVLRRLTVRWYTNPTGAPCDAAPLDRCDACAEVTIPYLPGGVELTLDGRTQRAWVDCGSGGVPAEPTLYGRDGGLFSWPVFGCGGSGGMCVEIVSDSRYTAPDMAVTVEMAARDDAA